MPARNRRRRGARVVLASVLAPALALLLAPDAAGATRTPSAADARPVEVEVTSLLPRAPTSGEEPLQVTGRLVHTGREAVQDLQVRLLVGDVVRTRSALAAADADPVPGRPRGPEVEPPLTRLAPGSRTTFDVRVPVGDLGLSRLGVYPLQVQVRGRVEGSRRTVELGRASTFVPWSPDGAAARNRLAFLWPLVDAPSRTPDGVLLDDEVAASLADDGDRPGRLHDLLSAARAGAPGACDPRPGALGTEPGTELCRRDPVPMTYAVDPELLETVAALGGDHAVADGSATRAEPPSQAARRWLADLQEALAGAPGAAGTAAAPRADLLALPYADPDVVGLTRERSRLTGDVEQLRLLGRRTAAELTGAEPLDAVAWPPPGPLTSAALDASLGAGATAVVLDEQALRRRADSPRTPGTRTALSSASAGRVTGLVVEEGLSRLLAASPEDPGWQGERLAEQRWIAEAAIVAAERPGEARTFVVAPPRRGRVMAGVAAEVLRDAGRLPWLCPVPLVDVAAGTERCPGAGADLRTGQPSQEGADLAAADADGDELPSSYLERVEEARALGLQLTDEVLVAGSDAAARTKARFLRAGARAESSAWRGDLGRGRRMTTLLREDVDRHRGQVRLTTSGQQLLTSDTGVVDVSITNALDQPVTVGVQLNDPIEARLTSTDTDVRTIGASEVVQVRLRVEARTSGQFVVRATLLDRAGQPFGAPAELIVRSTQFGRLAVTITGVAAGALLAAAGVRIARRALRRARPAVDGADG